MIGARFTLAALLLGLCAQPALAGEAQLFDGRVLWSDGQSNPVFDQAGNCGLEIDALVVSEERYRVLPATETEEAALDLQVGKLAEQAGLGSDPAMNQVSREFIRNLLISRVLMQLVYQGDGVAGGMACLTDWLVAQGFTRITAKEADAIRAARND
ncbi:MAG: hypothetical protein ACO25F_11880 [Erythrobacter sp.]